MIPQFVKDYTLPIAIAIGIIIYPIAHYLTPLTPVLLFAMLSLTFCKISIQQLRITPSHFVLLTFQISVPLALFYIIKPYNIVVAQAIAACVIAPTATAAAVVTNKLGGNLASITTYTLISNIALALILPITIPLIAPSEHNPQLIHTITHVLKKIVPLLIVPFLLAQFIQWRLPKLQKHIVSIPDLPFYLWALALTIAIGITMQQLLEIQMEFLHIIIIAVGTLFSAFMQFGFGRFIGSRHNDAIASQQSLGQKNTILAIWICHTYLNPLSTIGPGLYILWQNLINTHQLTHQRK